MKNYFAILVLALPTFALAQYGMEHAASRAEICTKMGGYAKLTLKGAKEGTPTTLSQRITSYMQPILRHIEEEVGGNPGKYTPDEAHMVGWGYCMDNIDRLTRAAKAAQ